MIARSTTSSAWCSRRSANSATSQPWSRVTVAGHRIVVKLIAMTPPKMTTRSRFGTAARWRGHGTGGWRAAQRHVLKPAFSGSAIVHLHGVLRSDADPVVVRVSYLRATLVSDGHGGFDAYVAGAIVHEEAVGAAFASVDQMLTARPGDHFAFVRIFDTERRPHRVPAEFRGPARCDRFAAVAGRDDRRPGNCCRSGSACIFAVRDGRCMATPATATCFDRMLNGTETDLDCGGSCGTCAAGATCTSAADCESAACDGTCVPRPVSMASAMGSRPTSTAAATGGGCAVGKACYSDNDCTASVRCPLHRPLL